MVTLECVDKLIRKDMVDPVNGEKLTDRDIIVLQRVRGVVVHTPPDIPGRGRGGWVHWGFQGAHTSLPPSHWSSLPSPGRHRLRGLRSEAAGREVEARDAGLSPGKLINWLPCSQAAAPSLRHLRAQ